MIFFPFFCPCMWHGPFFKLLVCSFFLKKKWLTEIWKFSKNLLYYGWYVLCSPSMTGTKLSAQMSIYCCWVEIIKSILLMLLKTVKVRQIQISIQIVVYHIFTWISWVSKSSIWVENSWKSEPVTCTHFWL